MSYSQHPASRWAPKPSTSLCCWRREANLPIHISLWPFDSIFRWFPFHTGQVSSTFSQSRHWPKLFLSWRCRYMGKCFVFVSAVCQCLWNTVFEFHYFAFRQLLNSEVTMFWHFFYLIRLARPYQISLEENQDITGESGIKSVEEIGIPIQYEFRVSFDLPVFSLVHPHVFEHNWALFLFKTDWKFWSTPETFCQCVAKHLVAQREFCGKMAPLLDPRQ